MPNHFRKHIIEILWLLLHITIAAKVVTAAEEKSCGKDAFQLDSKVFDRYWEFFDSFKKCTLHFHKSTGSCTLLYTSFWRKCKSYQNCLVISTTDKFPADQRNKYVLPVSLGTFNIEKRIFQNQHFLSPCIVQLPTVSVNSAKWLRIGYYSLNFRKPLAKLNLFSGIRLPDFLFIPGGNINLARTLESIPSLWSVKTLLLDGYNLTGASINLVCVRCHKSQVLVSVPFPATKKADIMTWNTIHAVHNLRGPNPFRKSNPMQFIKAWYESYNLAEFRFVNELIYNKYNFSILDYRRRYVSFKHVAVDSSHAIRTSPVGSVSTHFGFSIIAQSIERENFNPLLVLKFFSVFSTTADIMILITGLMFYFVFRKLDRNRDTCF